VEEKLRMMIRKSAPSMAPVATPPWVRPSLGELPRNVRVRVIEGMNPYSTPAFSARGWVAFAAILLMVYGLVLPMVSGYIAHTVVYY